MLMYALAELIKMNTFSEAKRRYKGIPSKQYNFLQM